MSIPKNIEDLVEKYLENKCTSEDVELILQWISAEGSGVEQKAVIRKMLETASSNTTISLAQLEQQLAKTFENISIKINGEHKSKTKLITMRKTRQVFAAAAIVTIIAFGAYFVIHNWVWSKSTNKASNTVSVKDLSPGSNKAVLTLADGSKVILEDAQNGELTTQGRALITKKEGQLIYNKSAGSTSILYNVITTPRGGEYQLTLEDGSQVWLNAASSIKFPTSFQGKERRIEIKGEAYFEIAKDATRPFKVEFETSPGTKSEVTVLGTHFNIMCYSDKKVAKTTLIEGSVEISNKGNTAVLKPAQQANISEGETIKVLSHVNIDEVIAWKNGYFEFHSTDLHEVMEQIGRWYDVEISYEGKISKRNFGGKISRKNNASEVLKILEISQVHFRIEDKKIIVMP